MKRHVCPWWIGYFLLNPLRKLMENPEKILSQHISEGMTVMDFGSAMGYFSIPAAKIVGKTGKVLCVDIQERMLASLKKRAKKKGLDSVIETIVAPNTDLLSQYTNSCDAVLAIHVVHEVPDQAELFKALHSVLKPGGRLIFIEPPGHVSKEDFGKSLTLAGRYFTVFKDENRANTLAAELIKAAN